VFYYSVSCLLYSDFSLAKHPRGVLQEPHIIFAIDQTTVVSC
jgi:hypothetical protein